MSDHQTIAFVILAAGQGNRMNMDTPKQFLRVAGKSLLEHSYIGLHSSAPTARMVVVVPADGVALAQQMLQNHPEAEIIVGGESRQAST